MPGSEKNQEKWKPLLEKEQKQGEQTIHLSYRPDDAQVSDTKVSLPLSNVGGTVQSIEEFTQSGSFSTQTMDSSQTPILTDKDFEIEKKIGQGGMGAIFRGKQISLDRSVAIKVLKGGESELAIFLSEARVTGRLEHSNIVPIHYFGQTSDGIPHLAMKLVKGVSWLELIQRGNVPLKEHIQIIFSVCNALSYAHKNKIIHRDIKPENIMVGEFGEVFVMDWGLAASIAPEPDETILHVSQIESPAGTPGYMSPELACGYGEDQDETTDVYLLGASLHHAVTGKFRHGGKNLQELLENVIESEPYPYDKETPRELAAICNKATAQMQEDRYANIEEFKQALEKFLEHEQANILMQKGLSLITELEAATWVVSGTKGYEKESLVRKIHRLHGEIVFALEHALEMWDGAHEAREGLKKENKIMINYALKTEDLGFAQFLLSRFDMAKQFQPEVDKLKQKLDARTEELESLRETARRYDWSEVASLFGTIFLVAGILGALGCFLTGPAQRQENFDPWTIRIIWTSIISIIAIFSYMKVRALEVNSLVSTNVLGTWGAITIACILTGVINTVLGLPPFRTVGVASLMIGIGIVTMAFDTRKWLFVPAAMFFIGGIVMSSEKEYGLEIFGFLWLICLCTIGMAFKLQAFMGKTEDEEDIGIGESSFYNVNGSIATFFLLFFGYLAYYLTRSNISVAQMHLPISNITTITAWGLVFYAIGKFVNGVIADVIGGKNIFLTGMLGSITATCMLASGDGYSWFLFWWCLNSYFLAMGWIGLIKVCAHWYGNNEKRGTILGMMSCSYLMGDGIAKAFTTALTAFPLLIWKGLFFVPAAILALVALFEFVFLREKPSTQKKPNIETTSISSIFKQLFSSKAFLFLIWGAFGLTMIRIFFQKLSPIWLKSQGFTGTDAGYTSTLLPIAGMVGAFFAGWLSDQMKGNRGPIVISSIFLLGVLFFCASWIPYPSVFLILCGFLIYCAYSIIAGVAAIDIGGTRAAATTAGLLDGFGYLGSAAIFFMLKDDSDINSFIPTFAIVAVVLAITLIYLWKHYPTSPVVHEGAEPKTEVDIGMPMSAMTRDQFKEYDLRKDEEST